MDVGSVADWPRDQIDCRARAGKSGNFAVLDDCVKGCRNLELSQRLLIVVFLYGSVHVQVLF